jgi:hypothetical protein
MRHQNNTKKSDTRQSFNIQTRNKLVLFAKLNAPVLVRLVVRQGLELHKYFKSKGF